MTDFEWRVIEPMHLYRIEISNPSDVLVGTYLGRREANKALEKIAYEPEPRW